MTTEATIEKPKPTKKVCNTCEGLGVVMENAGACGACEFCRGREEKEVPCPECCGYEEDSEPSED